MGSKKVLFFMDFSDSLVENKKTVTPWEGHSPGLLPFIQSLRDKGHKIDFVISPSNLLKMLSRKKYDIVAFSILSDEFQKALKLLIKVKKIDPGVITVLGNWATLGLAPKLARHVAVDMAVEGEGDMTFPVMLDILEREKDSKKLVVPIEKEFRLNKTKLKKIKKHIGGVYYKSPITREIADKLLAASFKRTIKKNGKKIVLDVPLSNFSFRTREGTTINICSPENGGSYWRGKYIEAKLKWEKKNEEKYPFIEREYLKNIHAYPTEGEMQEYKIPWDIVEQHGWDIQSIFTQRGCMWGRCIFCGLTNVINRRLSPDKVISIIKDIKKHNFDLINIGDEMFTSDKEWVMEICDKIVKEKLNKDIHFDAITRIDFIDEELIKKLVAANFGRLTAGVETLIPKKAEYIQKTFNGKEYVRRAREFADLCFESGIKPGIFYILGTSHTTLNDIALDLENLMRLVRSGYYKYGGLIICIIVPILLPDYISKLAEMEKCNYKNFYLCPTTNGDLEVIPFPDSLKVDEKIDYFVKRFSTRERYINLESLNIVHIGVAIKALKDTVKKYNLNEPVLERRIQRLNKWYQEIRNSPLKVKGT